MPRLADHSQRHLPLYVPLFCQAETKKERIAFVYEEVNGHHWGKLCMHCTNPVLSDEDVLKLKTDYNTDKPFPELRYMDFSKVHRLITGEKLSPPDLAILLNFVRTPKADLETKANQAKLAFFQALLTVNHQALVKLLPELQRLSSNFKKKKNRKTFIFSNIRSNGALLLSVHRSETHGL